MSEHVLEFGHLEPGERVRLLDGEGSGAERRAWSAHVEACARCRAEVGAQERLLGAVSAELARLELPAGFRRPTLPARSAAGAGAWGAPWLRAAAAVAVLATIVGTVTPLRAWVAERWDTLAAAVLGGEAAPAAAPALAERQPTRLWFEAGSTLVVEVVGAQAAGTLTLRRSAEPRGLLELHGDDAGAALLSERGVRIEMSGGARASYVVGVPPSVAEVRVRIGGAERRVRAEELARPLVLELGGGGAP